MIDLSSFARWARDSGVSSSPGRARAGDHRSEQLIEASFFGSKAKWMDCAEFGLALAAREIMAMIDGCSSSST